jgi:hypothetical protein
MDDDQLVELVEGEQHVSTVGGRLLHHLNEARENGQEQGEEKEGEVSPELLINDCGPSLAGQILHDLSH